MKILGGIGLAFALMATGASAQSFSVVPTPDATYGFGTFGKTRVQIPLSTPLGGPAEPGVLETVRRTLYAQAQRECASLTNEFKAECRLSSLTVEGPTPGVSGPPPRPPSLEAVAVYELRSR